MVFALEESREHIHQLTESRQCRVGFYRHIGQWHAVCLHGGGEVFCEHRHSVFLEVGQAIHEAPLLCLLRREPAARLHQRQQVFHPLLALTGVHLRHVPVHLLKVGLHLRELVYLRLQLVGVEGSPLEELRRALMHKVHRTAIHRDMLCPHRSNGGSTGIHPYKMGSYVAVFTECGSDRKRGCE